MTDYESPNYRIRHDGVKIHIPERPAIQPRAADYLGAKNDPVGPTSGPAVPGKSRRLKRNPKS